MTAQMKMILASFAVLAAVFGAAAVTSAWSDARLSRLEQELERSKRFASEAEKRAATLEIEANAYRQKTEYLEKSLAEIRAIARKQDEELETLDRDTAAARSEYERAKRTRSITAAAEELCRKLAELGHPCK